MRTRTTARPAEPIRVSIVGARPVVLSLIKIACEATGGMTVRSWSADPLDPEGAADTDVVVIDADGVDDVAAVTAEAARRAAVVVIADRADGASIVELIAGGARAFVMKPEGLRTMRETIARVHAGEYICDEVVARAAAVALQRKARISRESSRLTELITERQRQVLSMLATGSTVHQVAHRLGISPRTVERHITALNRALGTSSRVHAVARGASLGLIELPD